MRSRLLSGLSLVAALGVLAGCATGPDTGPVAVTGDNGGNGQAPASSAAPRAPALEVPKTDLAWADCGKAMDQRFADVRLPAGTVVQCATFRSPVDPDTSDSESVTIDAIRLSTRATPATAAPLVATTGSDLPVARALAMLAQGDGRSLLATRPIVGIAMRGTAVESPIDCMTSIDTTTIVNNGTAGYPGPVRAPAHPTQQQRIDRLAASASSAADTCTDTLSPHQVSFTSQLAATDLETLRTKWGVGRLAVLGIGSGSDVAMSYAAQYPDRVARLILDTPTPFGASSRDRALARAAGVQRALTTFAQRCPNIAGCALGADGTTTIAAIMSTAAAGRLDDLSDTNVLTAITTALATATTDEQRVALSRAIEAASRGDVAPLTELVTSATRLRDTNAQLLSRCNDTTGTVGLNQVPGLIAEWSKQNPLTGANSALSLARCTGWATTPVPKAPTSYPVAPLVLAAANDPLNGSDATALNPGFTTAGTTPVTVSWDGLGYSVLAHSSCAADTVGQYLDTAPLEGPAERGCPS